MAYSNLQRNTALHTQLIKAEQFQDVVQSHHAENNILKAIETFAIGFIQLDYDWKINYWNLAAENLTGYKQAQALHKNLFQLVKEINHIQFYKNWQNRLKNHKSVKFRDYFWPTQKWFEFQLYAIDETIYIHFQDITKVYTTKKTLSNKIRQLREVSVFNSHAMRKPLANLMGLTTLLSEQTKLSGVKEYLGYIRESTKNLDEIIQKINKMAGNSAESENECNLEQFYFKDIVTEVKEEITRLNKNHRLIISCSNVLFYGNREGIKKSIKTLAFNENYSNGIHNVKISIKIKDGDLYVRIRDYGKVLSQDELNEIHATLIDNNAQNGKENMASVAKLCFQHNGSFWIENHIDKGTNYFMLFPLSSFSIFTSSYAKKSLTEVLINFDEEHQCLCVKWDGYFDASAVKKSFYKIYEAMKLYKCSKVISNELNKVGAGTNSIKWLLRYGFPLLHKAGLSQFASIASKNVFAQLNTKYLIKTLNTNHIRQFSVQTQALKWIESNHI